MLATVSRRGIVHPWMERSPWQRARAGPVREPDALCEGCGARGTESDAPDVRTRRALSRRCTASARTAGLSGPRSIGLAGMNSDAGPHLAWLDRSSGAEPSPQPPSAGAWFESATWHGVIEFVETLTLQARYYRDPPSPEHLARIAAEIRAHAGDKVGPMPLRSEGFSPSSTPDELGDIDLREECAWRTLRLYACSGGL